jgi:xylan 1,4-beta-xylosidase
MSGGAAWPDDDQWAVLRRANRLEELEPPRRVDADRGVVELAFDLPMPSVSLVELVPPERSPRSCEPAAWPPSPS